MSFKALCILLPLSLLTACGSSNHAHSEDQFCSVADNGDGSATLTCPDGTTATVGSQDCHVNPSTILMHYEWNEAEMFRRDCSDEARTDYHLCMENGTSSECMSARDDREEQCGYIYAGWLNKIPLRECGATIWDIISNPWDGGYSRSVNQTDFDGDGIGNWHEFLMGLNPCTPNAYGACVNDADLDFDADGKPNGTDDNPYCNPDNDPAGWFTDCV